MVRIRAPVNNKVARMSTFGERLRSERNRLGLNQDDFAALGGVKKRAQITYEQDERLPDAAYLQGVAGSGVDVLYVLIGETAVNAITSDEKELLLGYRLLDVRVKAGVLSMVNGFTVPGSSPSAVFKGDVGQVVKGNQTNTGPLNFTVGGGKKKKE
ncbi:MAG: helix-turn-helix domain-containing protein [Burkholderiaceae bacterium]